MICLKNRPVNGSSEGLSLVFLLLLILLSSVLLPNITMLIS